MRAARARRICLGSAGKPIPASDPRGWATEAPSATPYAPVGWETPAALDEAGLARIKAAFVDAAIRADRIGFEVAELHAAHGYLLHQFLSPLSNLRTDAYGGSLENRMRFPLEVFDAVAAVWPKHKALGVRFSATDWVARSSWDIAESTQFAAALKARGCDFIDVSSAGNSPEQNYRGWARLPDGICRGDSPPDANADDGCRADHRAASGRGGDPFRARRIWWLSRAACSTTRVGPGMQQKP